MRIEEEMPTREVVALLIAVVLAVVSIGLLGTGWLDADAGWYGFVAFLALVFWIGIGGMRLRRS